MTVKYRQKNGLSSSTGSQSKVTGKSEQRQSKEIQNVNLLIFLERTEKKITDTEQKLKSFEVLEKSVEKMEKRVDSVEKRSHSYVGIC